VILQPVRSIVDRVPAERFTLGWQALAWTAAYLLQPDGPDAGKAWKYTPEQVRMLLRWYEIDEAGRFSYRRGVIRRLKGWGKDPFAASLMAIELMGPCRFGGRDAEGLPVAVEHPAPWIQTAAVAKDQTRNTMTLFPGMLSPAAVDEYGIDPGKEIIYTRAGGRLEAVTSNPRSLEGGRPSLVVANETHHWLHSNEGIEMMSAIRRNARKSRDGAARVLEITNGHLPGEGSVAEASHDAIANAGTIKGVYYDSVEAPFVTRTNADGDVEVTPLADMTDDEIRASVVAARCDAVWLDVEGILDEARDPTTSEGVVRRFYFNQIFRAERANWFAPGVWMAKTDTERAFAPGDSVVIALDGSYNGDSTGLIICSTGDHPHVDVLDCWEAPDDDEEWQVNILDVEETVRKACALYEVAEIVCDPYRWQHSMAVWSDEGLTVVDYPQSAARMTPATQHLERLVKARDVDSLSHSGDGRLARHVDNAVAVEDSRGRRIRKVNKWSRLHIDLAVATIMAVDRAVRIVDTAPNIW